MGYRILPRAPSRIAHFAERLAFLSVPLVLIGVLVTRSGKIDQMHGLSVVVLAALLAAFALGLCVVAAVEIWRLGRFGLLRVFRAMLASAIVLALPGWMAVQSLRLPRINDLSTDLIDPPSFSVSPEAIVARGGYVPTDLPASRREMQRRFYPEIRTLILLQEPEAAYQNVLDAVDTLKWTVIEDSTNAGERQIEAVAETRLMRFKDDISIRIRAVSGETRIDIRSRSRLGRHDFGANAARIQRLVQELTAVREL